MESALPPPSIILRYLLLFLVINTYDKASIEAPEPYSGKLLD
jgi:hypothetical protein